MTYQDIPLENWNARLRTSADFGLEDLTANQHGYYTQRQIDQYLAEKDAMRRNWITQFAFILFGILACGLAVVLKIQIRQMSVFVLMGGVLAIGLFFTWLSNQWKLPAPKVPKRLPTIHMVEGQADTGTTRTRGGTYHFVRVGKKTFYLRSKAQTEGFVKKGYYRVYYRVHMAPIFLSAEMLAPPPTNQR